MTNCSVLLQGISRTVIFSDQMEGFDTLPEKSQRDMEDAEFYEESENATYLQFWQLLPVQIQNIKSHTPNP